MRRLTKNSSVSVTIHNQNGEYIPIRSNIFENETSTSWIIYLAKCALEEERYRKGLYSICISDRNDNDFYYSKNVRIN